MEARKYKYLIGKSRKEIITVLGQEFNDYYSFEWSYQMKESWWGKWVLIISFKDEKVESVDMRKVLCLF